MRTWYENLAAAIRKSGLTQRQIAARLGVQQATISNWIRGERTPNVESIQKLARVLGMSIHEMLGDQAIILERDIERKLIAIIRNLSEEDERHLLRIAESLAAYESSPEDAETDGD